MIALSPLPGSWQKTTCSCAFVCRSSEKTLIGCLPVSRSLEPTARRKRIAPPTLAGHLLGAAYRVASSLVWPIELLPDGRSSAWSLGVSNRSQRAPHGWLCAVRLG